jgi:large subunit ribosomal protein L24
MKIKKGDTVLIISGKDKGKKGNVLRVLPKEEKVIVENVNILKRHTKPRRSGEKGQIIQKPGPIHISDVKLICSKCGEATKVGYKVISNIKNQKSKIRICKKCGQET